MHNVPKNIMMGIQPLDIQASEAKSGKKMATFEMMAYDGEPMQPFGFDLPVVVDLGGMTYKTPLEVNYGHISMLGVGHADTVNIENNQLFASGKISRENDTAKDVAQSGVNGFPWQASIGAVIEEIIYVRAGETILVNGQSYEGEIYVASKSELKHISFVEAGADSDTSAKIAAKAAQNNNTNERIGVSDMDNPKDKTEPQKTKLDAASQEVSDKLKAEAKPEDVKKADKAEPENNDIVKDIRAQAKAETERIKKVKEVCLSEELQAKAIDEGWSVEKAELEYSKSELNRIRASRPETEKIEPKKEGGEVNSKVFEINAMRAAGMRSEVIEKKYDEATLEAADKHRRQGLTEMIEAASGVQLGRYPRDAQAQKSWLQAAFSSVDLSNILNNVANKVLWESYASVDQTWRQIAKTSSVSDFKESQRYRFTDAMKFQKVAADGELQHGEVGEIQYTNQADTYGIMISITRQMLINDDLGAFAELPNAIGIGAADALNEIFWNIWLANSGDFFGTGNSNLVEGTSYVLSLAGLKKAKETFMGQTKPNGSPLGMRPEILLVPTELEDTARQLMVSEMLNETTTANKAKPARNIYQNMFRVVSTPYLSNSSINANASSTAYYLLGNPQRIPCIDVAFLNGIDTPTVEQADADFNTLGIQLRGYYDFGVALQDFRGGVKVTGVAS